MSRWIAAFWLASALAATAGSSAAADLSGRWYVAAAVTGSDLNKPHQTIANAPTPGSTLQVVNDVNFAWGGAIAVGRSLGPVRVEAEFGRTLNRSDAYTAITPLSITLPQKGKNEITRYMLNAYYDLPKGSLPVQFDLGAGIGAADAHVTTFAAPARAPNIPPSELINQSQTRFAYQLMAGAALPVTDRLSLTAQYRWLDVGKVKGVDARGERMTRTLRGHNVDLGVRFSF